MLRLETLRLMEGVSDIVFDFDLSLACFGETRCGDIVCPCAETMSDVHTVCLDSTAGHMQACLALLNGTNNIKDNTTPGAFSGSRMFYYLPNTCNHDDTKGL